MLSFTRQCRHIIQVKWKTFRLHFYATNLLRIIYAKFYQNRLGFVLDDDDDIAYFTVR